MAHPPARRTLPMARKQTDVLAVKRASKTCLRVTILAITTTILAALFVYHATSLHHHHHNALRSRFARYLGAAFSGEREGYHVVYWTPHKTGSTSMRTWLRSVAIQLRVTVRQGPHYPNAPLIAWPQLAGYVARHTDTCSIATGHIHVQDADVRDDERKLGAVITTFRNPVEQLASKYFHRTNAQLAGDLREWRDPRSRPARFWFFYWNDHDPCEQLRYYDGQPGCHLPELRSRIARLAQRIDCAVDMDDPTADLDALCHAMHLDRCPPFPFTNARPGTSTYDELLAIPHVRAVMQRVLNVSDLLRHALLQRRCRFLHVPHAISFGAFQKPQWPYPGCNNGSSSFQQRVKR